MKRCDGLLTRCPTPIPMAGRFAMLCCLPLMLASAGCNGDFVFPYSLVPCNGTNETVYIQFPGPLKDETTLEPCSCGQQYDGFVIMPNPTREVSEIVTIRDGERVASAQVTLTIPLTQRDAQFVIYNGLDPFTPEHLSRGAPFNIQLCNESTQPVHIGDDLIDPPGLTERSLTPAGACRCWLTPQRDITFQVFAADATGSDAPLATCGPVIPDPHALQQRVVWDGATLRCGESGPPPGVAEIELCNTDVQSPNPVHILRVDEVPSDDSLLASGACRTIQVPAGEHVAFQARDFTGSEGVLGICELNDPSNGDRVIWDGTRLVCQESADSTTAAGLSSTTPQLKPIPDPLFTQTVERRFWVRVLKEYSQLSTDAKDAVRARAKELLEATLPMGSP